MVGRGQSPEAREHFFHVTHNKETGKWYVKEVKSEDQTTHDSKEKAVKKAEALARNVEQGHIVIHREDGTFETIENITEDED